jgi:hypothetical protein
MRLLLLLALLALLGADYPEVEKLPVQAELPDPLVTRDGKKITSADEWRRVAVPQLKKLFEHYEYGPMPPAPKNVEAKVEREDKSALGGKATLREVTLTVAPDAPAIHLLVVVPNDRKGPVPVFVGMNFTGNHTLVADPKVRIPDSWMYPGRAGVKENRATAEGCGSAIDVWALDQSIDRGYGVVTFYNGDVDPDVKESRGGLRPWLKSPETGTLAAWAWGLSRAVDYIVKEPLFDAKRISVVGHSRLGKAALVAAAFDERIALCIPLQAGCGGTSPARGKVGESVKRITTAFPHWFTPRFAEFGDRPERLPFDQHCLVALVAPRPVLFANATEDTWANPAGQFEVLKAANPVYRLLGTDGLEAKEMPAENTLSAGALGYYIRPGKHSMTRGDWKVFLDYADKRLR